jgi:hypothetical protein
LVATDGEKITSVRLSREPGRWQAGRPVWLFWLLLVVMGGLSVLNTALRMSRDITAPRP